MPAAAQAVSRSSAVGTAWRGLPPEEQAARLREAWDELDADGRFLLVKLIGGGFRVGVSKLLVQRALAEQAGLDGKVIAQSPLVALSAVEEGGFFKRLWHELLMWWQD